MRVKEDKKKNEKTKKQKNKKTKIKKEGTRGSLGLAALKPSLRHYT